MKLKRIWITNYKEFRRTFEGDEEAASVEKNLKAEAEALIRKSRLDFTISAPYDDFGYALFDVTSFKVLPNNEIIINVIYTGTAK
jgi:hypothetical protein